MTEEEFNAKQEAKKQMIDDMSPEEQMIALLAILENTKDAIKSLESQHKGLTKTAKEILSIGLSGGVRKDEKSK